MTRRVKQGFTLPELLVVLFLLSLLSSFLLRCFAAVATQQEQRLALLELENNLAIAQSWLGDDIAKSSAVLDCAAEQLTLQQDQLVSYTLGTDQQITEHLYPLEEKFSIAKNLLSGIVSQWRILLRHLPYSIMMRRDSQLSIQRLSVQWAFS